MCESGKGQQVAQLHVNWMIMMTMILRCVLIR